MIANRITGCLCRMMEVHLIIIYIFLYYQNVHKFASPNIVKGQFLTVYISYKKKIKNNISTRPFFS